MPIDDATKETIINVIKERPELLRNINIAIGQVLAEAGIEVGDLSPDELLSAVADSMDEPADP